jgi:hypothetical protein
MSLLMIFLSSCDDMTCADSFEMERDIPNLLNHSRRPHCLLNHSKGKHSSIISTNYYKHKKKSF